MALRLAQLSEILPAGRRSFEVRRASVISQPPWLPEDSGALDPPQGRRSTTRCALRIPWRPQTAISAAWRHREDAVAGRYGPSKHRRALKTSSKKFARQNAGRIRIRP